jgi:hypothetical protein
MFIKSFLASSAVILAASLQVSAHAAIAPALGAKSATVVRNDAQRPSAAAPCGNVNIASTLDTSTAVAANNGVFTATVTNFNGGIDGSRFVTAQVDATGTGKSFVAATVQTNGDKSPTSTGSQQLSVALPAGTTCTGGAGKNKCLVSFKTAGNFGNCVAVTNGGAAAAAPAAAAPAPAAAAAGVAATTGGAAAVAGAAAAANRQGQGNGGGRGRKGANRNGANRNGRRNTRSLVNNVANNVHAVRSWIWAP